ncbi:molybdate transport system substrate-binding protein [Frigoribacterium sp. PhB160]|uniref:molybdate ABC transporter substrate-binding protein n=1 Tax=Frigoribacterium sp. PhB160 TaxID=2485192 RepID=UPI000F462673|nr:molybdate ABC transporter substrate-binding protein [Frigoribacterium sp. PhB160]ROS59353.1 molybdate transport system substrate-binding protein [Frigoribacterium sp. PhB160]
MTTLRRTRASSSRTALTALGAVAALTLAACSSSGAGDDATADGTVGASATPGLTGEITVLAAASLTETFDALAADFEAANPGTTVTLSYGGSSALAQQITAGSPVDDFFSASAATMTTVTDAGLVEGEPATFARNRLEIAVPPGNPADVASLADLASPDVTVALCAAEVPCGALATTVLDAAGVSVTPATLEPDVKSALTKVELGEVDAALVYRTDVEAAGDAVEGVEVGDDSTPTTSYLAGRLVDAPNPALADAFLQHVLSSTGQDALAAAGFTVG